MNSIYIYVIIDIFLLLSIFCIYVLVQNFKLLIYRKAQKEEVKEKKILANKYVVLIILTTLYLSLLIPINKTINKYIYTYNYEKDIMNAQKFLDDNEIINCREQLNYISEMYELETLTKKQQVDYYFLYVMITTSDDNIQVINKAYDYLIFIFENDEILDSTINLTPHAIELGINIFNITGDLEKLDTIANYLLNKQTNEFSLTKDSIVELLNVYTNLLKLDDLSFEFNIIGYLDKLSKMDYLAYAGAYTKYLLAIQNYSINTEDVLVFNKQMQAYLKSVEHTEDRALINMYIGSLYSMLSFKTYGSDYFTKSENCLIDAYNYVEIQKNPILYAEVCYELASLYKNYADRFDKQNDYYKALDYFDESLRIVDKKYEPRLYSKIHLTRAEIYRTLYGYEKVVSTLDKSNNEYEKARNIAESLKYKDFEGDYYKSLAENALNVSYINFVTNLEKIEYLRNANIEIDQAINFYSNVNNSKKLYESKLLKSEIQYRIAYIMHLIDYNEDYDLKKKTFNNALDLAKSCIKYYEDSTNDIKLEEAYFVIANILKDSWILDYYKGIPMRTKEQINDTYIKSEDYFNLCINSNDKLVNSRKRLEASVYLVLLYSGNLYIFDEVTNQKYLELGKNLISDLEMKICVEDDPKLFVKFYDYVGWWYYKIGDNQSDKKLKIYYLNKSFESRKFAENALTAELNPDIKVRLLRNIIITLEILHELSGSEEYLTRLIEYNNELEYVLNYYY